MFNPLPGIPVPGQSCSQNPEACGYFGRTERVALVFLAICLTAKLPMIFLDRSASNEERCLPMLNTHPLSVMNYIPETSSYLWKDQSVILMKLM